MSEEKRLRKSQLRVWLLEEEKQMIIKNAYEYNLSQSDYIRKMILAESLMGRYWTMDKEQGKDFLYELNRIGNNINQIAYNTNVKRYASNKDWEQLEKSFYELLSLYGKLPFLQKGEIEKWQQQIYTLLQKQ